jgi:predicted small lipoprotein YifL
MTRIPKACYLLLLLACLFQGCGQTGDLYLPDEQRKERR